MCKFVTVTVPALLPLLVVNSSVCRPISISLRDVIALP